MATETTPARAVVRGLLAGAVGTGVMTAVQTAAYKAQGAESSSVPAEVGKRISEGVFQEEVPEDRMSTLNTLMHWAYGTSWGVLYGIARGSSPNGSGFKAGLGFGAAVWGASLVHLPAMKLAPPVWEYPPSSLAQDLGFHLVYGEAVAAAYAALS